MGEEDSLPNRGETNAPPSGILRPVRRKPAEPSDRRGLPSGDGAAGPDPRIPAGARDDLGPPLRPDLWRRAPERTSALPADPAPRAGRRPPTHPDRLEPRCLTHMVGVTRRKTV